MVKWATSTYQASLRSPTTHKGSWLALRSTREAVRSGLSSEINPWNVGIMFDGGCLVFSKSKSASYGLTQSVVRAALKEELGAGEKLDGVISVE